MQIFKSDLDEIELNLGNLTSQFHQKSIFITGGTGFFGKWLLSAFAHLYDSKSAQFEVTVLSRNPEPFLKQFPHLKQPFIKWVQGDIRDFSFPDKTFDYLIHGATEASLKLSQDSPEIMFQVILEGMQRVLEFSKQAKVKRVLHLSSGAVYGAQPMAKVPESYLGGPDPLAVSSCYGEGKRAAELLGNIASSKFGFEVVHARCFAFVGPYLPLDTHFAVGNFILNCLRKENIEIRGDGTPYRSYLYPTDLVVWLITLLLKGKNREAYNVGSEEALSIKDLAQTTTKVFQKHLGKGLKNTSKINILKKPKKGVKASRYVPSTTKIKRELNLRPTVSAAQAILRTFAFETQRGIYS